MSHIFSVRVYYEDTDAAGIVYYANYLKFAERARTEVLRAAGIEQQTLMQEENIGFVVRRCVIDYLKPAMLDDYLTITTSVDDIARATLTMQQTIKRGTEILVTLSVKLACVDQKNGKVCRMPERVLAALND